MQAHSQESEKSKRSQNRLEQPLPDGVAPGNLRVLRQAAVALRISRIVQHVNHVCAADGLGIVHPRFLKAGVVAQLLGTLFGDELHVVLGAELQTSRGTSLDASWFQALPHAVGT
ncbi:MAG: hypothetical protein AUH86_03745 [Acidobacteria bacterium 13_1_40CM_4_58_4]|nr:MAG: hypothetical protein AUH86_03745 [Acidobacteria bacterium 13_1_40CM_4_58_4]